MEDPIRIFIGYDPAETVAYHVLGHSAIRLASRTISISPVALAQLRGIHRRPRHPKASTEFSITRFLVPWLCNYQGWAIFMDCDMLFLDDPSKLWELRDPQYAVIVVKHDHKPKESSKFLGREQTVYRRKNWSSVMLMNCAECADLTPRYVDTADGLGLHGFRWLLDDQIGALPPEWNHLIGYDKPNKKAKLIHYTHGGPWHQDYKDCEHAGAWFAEFRAMAHADDASDYLERTRTWQQVKVD